MRLIKGRDIGWEDAPKSQKVVVINETVARKLWPGQDPIGRTAQIGGTDARVIGVIADVHETNAEEGARWQEYLSASQFWPEGAYLVLRSKLPPGTLAPSVMRTLRQMNPGQPATEFKPIQTLVDHATSPRRFFMLLVSVFAGLGLLLASLGIYGVVSYSVTRQRQEIGIRMALGATQTNVLFGVLSRTLRLTLMGIITGTIGSFAAGRLISSLLFETRATDPATFAAMAGLLCMVALIAGYFPAHRAARIDPMVALRVE